MVFVPAQKLSGIRVWTPIRYVTLVFRDRRGAEQLRSVTEIAPKSPFLMCEQKPYLVWFSCQHKSYPVSGYEHLSDMWLSSLEIGAARSSFAPLQKSRRYQPFLCVNRSPIWYGFRAGAKTIWYSGNIALAGLGIVCYTAVFRVVTQWGALRDDTRNGCVADEFGNCSIHFFSL